MRSLTSTEEVAESRLDNPKKVRELRPMLAINGEAKWLILAKDRQFPQEPRFFTRIGACRGMLD